LITSCGQTVTTSAVLTQNLVCVGQHGVIVGASGITIDLGGFVIRGDGSNHDGIDDEGGFDSVTVKNGVLRNFLFGVHGITADKLSATNLVASGNAASGLNDLNGNFAKIQSSNFSGNGILGLRVDGDSASIKSVSAFGNDNIGIVVQGNAASIQSATVSGNTDAGIDLTGNAGSIKSASASSNGVGINVVGDSVVIQSSTASGNIFTGIDITGNSASLKSNHTDANGFPDGASDLIGLGIFVHDFTTPPAGKNTAHGNDDPLECIPALVC
jgi:large repetitive protein